MSLLVVGLLCLAIVQSSLCDDKTKESRDPIVEFLQLDANSQHELVDIQIVDRLHKRAYTGNSLPPGKHIKIRTFGSDVDLWLHPKNSTLVTEDTPVYYSRFDPYQPAGVNIELQPGLMRNVGKLFEDPAYSASFVIGTDQHGRTTLNGRIGTMNLGVRSLPSRIVDEYVELRREGGHSENDLSVSSYHVVYRIQGKFEDLSLTENDKVSLRRDSGVPHILYPKLLLAVDYSLFKSQENDIYAYLEYLMAFVNGIDLKYRALEYPSFRFHVAAIVIAIEDRGLPFISDRIVAVNTFDSLPAMVAAKRFYYLIKDTIPPEAYDLTLTLTKHSFGLKEGHVLGKSWVGVTCKNSRAIERVEAIIVAQDDNSFLGVHVAAHELGHAFGLHHDPNDVDECKYHNGFIMSFAYFLTNNSSTFSSCSLDEFQRRIDSRNYECMYQPPPAYGNKLPRLLPGKVRSLEEQCAHYKLGRPCNTIDENICTGIHCLNGYGDCEQSYERALEGTPCGDPNDIFKRYCINSQCVRV